MLFTCAKLVTLPGIVRARPTWAAASSNRKAAAAEHLIVLFSGHRGRRRPLTFLPSVPNSVATALFNPPAITLKGRLSVNARAMEYNVPPEKTGSFDMAKTGSHRSGVSFDLNASRPSKL